MICPKCETDMDIVEGEITPAKVIGGYVKDSEWGKWYECPNCHKQIDI